MYAPNSLFFNSSSLSVVTASLGSQVLARADPERVGLWVQSHTPGAVALSLGASASFAEDTPSHTCRVGAYGFWEQPTVPLGSQAWTCAFQQASGSVMVSELYFVRQNV